MKKTIQVKISEDKIIKRVPTFHALGNFQMVTIRYNNAHYLVGDGDEYLREGYEQIFELGKKLDWNY